MCVAFWINKSLPVCLLLFFHTLQNLHKYFYQLTEEFIQRESGFELSGTGVEYPGGTRSGRGLTDQEKVDLDIQTLLKKALGSNYVLKPWLEFGTKEGLRGGYM